MSQIMMLFSFFVCLLPVVEVFGHYDKFHDLAYYELVKVNDELPAEHFRTAKPIKEKVKGRNLFYLQMRDLTAELFSAWVILRYHLSPGDKICDVYRPQIFVILLKYFHVLEIKSSSQNRIKCDLPFPD